MFSALVIQTLLRLFLTLSGKRVPNDLVGLTQTGIGCLPDLPQHIKAAFSWRAVSSAERAVQASSSVSAAPVILSSGFSMSAQFADFLAGKVTPAT